MTLKAFDLNSVLNPLATRPGLIELCGHRIALPGVLSHEPLLRGCNQHAWLERLVGLGIRHLIVPVNGREEDTCLYARRHPNRPPGTSGQASAVYDLERRDEGFFARLKFLLDAAGEIGVMIGLSLFSVTSAAMAGPLRQGANLQGLSFENVLHATDRQATTEKDNLEASLNIAVDWIATEVRGRPAVWIEIFRGLAPVEGSLLNQSEKRLALRIATVLGRSSVDSKKAQGGPWVATPPGFLAETGAAHIAPFSVQRGDSPELKGVLLPSIEASQWCEDDVFAVEELSRVVRRPSIFRLSGSRKNAMRFRASDRATLWRGAMRGIWPIVPGGFNVSHVLPSTEAPRSWIYLAQLATFAKQWVGHGFLRACPELLALMPREAYASGRLGAATDGCGRYFVYSSGQTKEGLVVSTFPGSYRYYWFDPASGRGLDRGDGLDGGTGCEIPGPGGASEAVLILEQEELPDPLSVW